MQTCTSSEKPPSDKFRGIDLSVVLSPTSRKNHTNAMSFPGSFVCYICIIADPFPSSPVGRSETTDIDAGSVNSHFYDDVKVPLAGLV
jgi:hypothetical protein